MQYYLAPLEGITTHVYRRAYHSYFYPMDKYFTPFLVPHTSKSFTAKEKNEILPEHNPGQNLVPQIMTNQAKDFVRTALRLTEYGYQEVNLNLGCPSGTVVSKGRGAGFLADPEKLNSFFDEIFSSLNMRISVKTRIGLCEPEEFCSLLAVYNQYPFEEIIIHPRVRQDFYKNHPNLEAFAMAYRESVNPVCYNGDLCSKEDLERFTEQFPATERIMIGRGILKNPGLVGEIQEGRTASKEQLRNFHDQIYEDYRLLMGEERNTIFKMKEFWTYMLDQFPEKEKLWKKMKKAQNAQTYEAVAALIFQQL